jgi:DNA-binding response OmpR family regulator
MIRRGDLADEPGGVRVLLAEDDDELRSAVAHGLCEVGFAVDEAPDGEHALQSALANDYDLIVLDLMMPKRHGLDVCRLLRESGRHTPVLMLTALDAVGDRVAGLDVGADDYLVKPFAFGELVARVRALLRRGAELVPPEIVVGDLVVDTMRRTVRRGGRAIRLTTKEYAFLEYLARNAERVVTRAELSDHVWDDTHDPFSNLVEVYVSRLRRKIDGDASASMLSTYRAVGYMLSAHPTPTRE